METWKFDELINKASEKEKKPFSWAEIIIGGITVGAILVVSIPIIIYSIWANAYVGKILWEWFVANTFNLPPLTMAQAWGLSMIITMWTYQHNPCKSKEERDKIVVVTEWLVLAAQPWIYLFFGWICYHYFIKG